MNSKKNYRVPAITRMLDIFEFIAQGQTVSFEEIHTRLNIPKSSAYQLIRTVEERGYLRRIEQAGKYALGFRLYELGNLAIAQVNIRDEAMPILRELMNRTNQTCHLSILDGNEGVYVAKVESMQPVRIYTWEGKRVAFHATAMGKILLAWLHDQHVDDILDTAQFPRFTESTITDPNEFKAHLRMVKERGWALDDQESEYDIRCIAAPIIGAGGDVVAALSVSGLANNLKDDVLPNRLDMVLDAARSLSLRLGNRQEDVFIPE